MKLFALALMMLKGFWGVSQSKKIQIQELNYKLDSIETVHEFVLKAYVDSIESLRREAKMNAEKMRVLIKRKDDEISHYGSEINSLQQEITVLKRKANTYHNSSLPQFLIDKEFKLNCNDADEKYVLRFIEDFSKINSTQKAVFISGYEWGGEIIRAARLDENCYKVHYLNDTEYDEKDKIQFITFEIKKNYWILFADQLLTNCEEGNDVSTLFDLEQEIEIVENRNEEVKETVVEVVEEPEIEIIVEVIEPVVDFPDVEASFIGGETAMQRWMQENLQYPEISMEMGEQGTVYLKFVVEKDGKITNVEVIKGVSRDLDNEAKRLVRTMPRWNAGESKGLKVRSSFTMPINF